MKNFLKRHLFNEIFIELQRTINVVILVYGGVNMKINRFFWIRARARARVRVRVTLSPPPYWGPEREADDRFPPKTFTPTQSLPNMMMANQPTQEKKSSMQTGLSQPGTSKNSTISKIRAWKKRPYAQGNVCKQLVVEPHTYKENVWKQRVLVQ